MKVNPKNSIPWYSQSDSYGRTAVQWYQQVLNRSISRFPNGFWEGAPGRQNAAACLEHAFRDVLGIKFDRATLTIDPLLREKGHTTLLSTKVNAPKKNWGTLFQQLRLLGCLAIPEFKKSPAIAIMSSFPWAFDLNTPEGKHIHPWDFIVKDLWTGDKGFEFAKFAVRHVFTRHLNVTMDPATGTIDERMMPEPGTKFPEKYTRLPRIFGCNEWWELFEKEGISGMLYIQEKFKMKPYLALYYAFSWAFDLGTPEGRHLHPWDFVQTKLWCGEEGRELARAALAHVISSHLGLEMKPPDARTGKYKIDQRLLDGDMGAFFEANGGTSWASLQDNKLLFLKEIYDDNPDLIRNFHQTFRWVFPWAFNLGAPEGKHAHFWDISTQFDWIIERDIIDAVTHEVNREGWSVKDLPEKATSDWFCSVGFCGLLDHFGNSRVRLLKHVYKSEFEKNIISEADFMIRTDKERFPVRAIVPDSIYDRPVSRVWIEGVNYLLPASYIGMFAKKIDGDRVGILKRVRHKGGYRFVQTAHFDQVGTKGHKVIRDTDITPDK